MCVCVCVCVRACMRVCLCVREKETHTYMCTFTSSKICLIVCVCCGVCVYMYFVYSVMFYIKGNIIIVNVITNIDV